MLIPIAATLVVVALIVVLAYGTHARLHHPADPPHTVCTVACEYPAESCCRRCVLYEACGIRANAQTGEVACKLV